ncbi:alpha/beta hydrolase [Aspergillus homomorphus CBS 101889]|uniref:Alpha/beta-hydrolase n=1 Tax=Aspergillus homomorphus (strain CBS 101889) TaxID=1450537 RepID=A0A395HZ56_ASPHC|nr:alpha/beta-hydrolase [Aspergillus homomorphus CBS 101889]RAL13080.1 alpha/beta-hydrolase [Aspergillus homomorphus CBS 101889]
MASDPATTTILFVPGAWHNPHCYDKVIENLKETGYTTELVHLPSVGATVPVPDTSADISQIRNQIDRLAATGQKIIVVAHSYGGLVASEAIQHLDQASRQAQSLTGGVTHLFLCCAFIVPEGRSLLAALGGTEPSWFNVSPDRMTVTPIDPVNVFYNDLPEDEARAAVAMLRPHSYRTLHSPCRFAAWRVVPTTYLYCEKDRAIPLSVQRRMVEETARGCAIRTETLDAAHSPFLSVPGEVADAIRRAAGMSV